MKCVLLNRCFPPNPGITGVQANRVAVFLQNAGVEVTGVSIDGRYDGVKEASRPDVPTVRVPAVYNGKQKILRLVATLIEGRRLVTAAAKTGATQWLTMTDPPLLNAMVAPHIRRKGHRWVYWTMDLYPDAFQSAGILGQKHPVYRHFARQSLAAVPDHLVCLGPNQAKHLHRLYASPPPTSLLPCGISRQSRAGSPPPWHREDRITFGYAGNLGEAHSVEFLEAVVRQLDPERHQCVLALFGVHAARMRQALAGLPGVVLVDSVSRAHLPWIDVHLASLKPEWDHVCVPSKAVSAVCAGGALFYWGSAQGDNWELLHEAGWRVDPAHDPHAEVAAILPTISPSLLAEKRAAGERIIAKLEAMEMNAMQEIADGMLGGRQCPSE